MVTNLMILLCCGCTIWSGQCQETDSMYKLYVKTLEKYNRVSDVLTLSSSPDAIRSRKEHFLGFANTKNLVDRINSDDTIPFTAELNMFSVMTKAERDLHKGLSGNMSEMILAEESLLSSSEPVNLLSAPSSVDHSQNGQVPVKNQGNCGSCWAYSAISALDFAYYKVTGDLIAFSEQEMLDCVYNSQRRDGCKGGWMNHAYNVVQAAGRLASEQDAPYQGKDPQGCSSGRWRNSFTKAKLNGHQTIRGDQQLLAAAATNVVAVCLLITDRFNVFKSGIFEDQTRVTQRTDHAVSLVGYGNSNGQPFWKVRNSWGKNWGSGGHIYMCRKINNIIGLSLYCFIPKFTCSGSCNPPDINGEREIDIHDDGSCKNKQPDDFCNEYISYCSTPKKTFWYYAMKKYCKKTCKICHGNDDDQQDNADGCPSGLKKCSDGKCRHAHMCH